MADKQVQSINPATGDVIETFASLTGADGESVKISRPFVASTCCNFIATSHQ